MRDEDDPRGLNSDWHFEKTVPSPSDLDWEDALELYNTLQTENLDLYAEISDLEHGWWERLSWYVKTWFVDDDWDYDIVFENERVYEWFESLAVEYESGVGFMVKYLKENEEKVMEHLGLEGSRSLVISSVDVDQGGNTVSKDELEDIVEAEKAEEIVSSKDDEGLEEQGFRDDDFPEDIKG